MLHRLLRRRRARSSKKAQRLTKAGLQQPEALELRALLAADPIGEALLVSDSALGTRPTLVTSVDALVVGQQQSTIVFHGQSLGASRLPGTDREIFFQQYEDNESAGPLTTANQVTRGQQAGPRTAAAADGSFWIAWSGRGEGDREGIFARRFDADGAALGDQIRVNTTRGGAQTNPDVAVAADGSAIVVWQGVGDGDFDGIFVQRIAADGSLVGDETLVNMTVEDLQAYPKVALTSDSGEFTVVWSSRHQDGDGWGIFARRFDADNEPLGDEFQVNETTTGSQHKAAIDADASGGTVITWSSLGQDGDSWGVYARQFAADGTPRGGEFQVHTETTGHQRDATVAAADAGEFLVAWNDGPSDGSGWEVMARAFDGDGQPDGDPLVVNESTSGFDSGHQAAPAVALNAEGNSVVAFQGDAGSRTSGVFAQAYAVEVTPAENVRPDIVPIDETTGTVGQELAFQLQFSDPNRNDELTVELDLDVSPASAMLTQIDNNNGFILWTPSAEDRLQDVDFRVIVTDNGDPPMAESTQFFVSVENVEPTIDLNGSETGIDLDVTLPADMDSVDIGSSMLTVEDADQSTLQSARLTLAGVRDTDLELLSVDTSGTAIEANFANNILTLSGTDTVEAYQSVMRTLEYTNSAGESRSGGLRQVRIVVSDGDDNSTAAVASIDVVGEMTGPSLAAIPDQMLLSGSPLHIPLDGFDADGQPLTYTVTSSDPDLVSTFIPQGNRSLRMSVSSPGNGISGDMVFELFEGRAPRVTEQIIALAEMDFYDGLIFHRVIDGFVIQGGDPLGNGTGGSDLPDFDDQFKLDLQHNRTGILSMAKGVDDSNNSQFFVTEGPTRNLDGNHSIFGILVEGEAVREAISNVPTGASERPSSPVTMETVSIFEDNENAVLMLSADEGASGSAMITVAVSDGTFTTERTFEVTVTPDTANTTPFLADIEVEGLPVNTIDVAVDTPRTFQLEGIDVEGDPIFYFDPDEAEPLSGRFPDMQPPAGLEVTVSDDGLMTITPSNGLTGTFQVTVGVGRSDFAIDDLQNITIEIA